VCNRSCSLASSIVAQLVKKILAFCGIRRLNLVMQLNVEQLCVGYHCKEPVGLEETL
jgi:hypothetical protein